MVYINQFCFSFLFLEFYCFVFFFFNDTATTEIYTLSLHDALPIYILDGRLRKQRLITRWHSATCVDVTRIRMLGRINGSLKGKIVTFSKAVCKRHEMVGERIHFCTYMGLNILHVWHALVRDFLSFSVWIKKSLFKHSFFTVLHSNAPKSVKYTYQEKGLHSTK